MRKIILMLGQFLCCLQFAFGQNINDLIRKAESGDINAQSELGYRYEKGQGVDQDYAEAVKWYRKAADKGDPQAQAGLGFCYEKGYGVAKNEHEALRFCRMAAEQGNARAQNNLASYYQNGIVVTKDDNEAAKWCRKAAEQGFALAQANLGLYYHFGIGVAQSDYQAVKWYRKAAEQGCAEGQSMLGYSYYYGAGVEKDFVEAVKWYRKAAEQGLGVAQFFLGACYYYGTGVTKNYTEAAKWFRKSAEQGVGEALDYLGVCYENGLGVQEDKIQAMAYYEESAKKGCEPAQAHFEKLQATMTPTSTKSKADPSVLPNLEVVKNSLAFVDVSGQNAIQANGRYALRMQVRNSGKAIAQKCTMKVTKHGNTSDINLHDIGLQTIAVGETKTLEIPITTGMKTENGSVEFALQMDEPNGMGTDPQYITITTHAYEPPLLQITDYSITSNGGNILKKKQPFDLQLLLQNIKTGNGEDVTVNLSLPENVMLIEGKSMESFSNIGSGETKSLIYSLIVNNNYVGTSIPIEVHVAERYGKYAEDKLITLQLEQSMASTKIEVNAKQKERRDIVIARLKKDVDTDIPVNGAEQNNTFAVIIGNEMYSDETDVPYAENDAKVFKEYCQQTLGISENHIRYISNAGYNDIRRSVNWLKQGLEAYGGEGSAIFYYAGHGIPDEAQKTAYILPVDGIGSDIESAYSLERLYQTLGEMPAKSITVFLDACFSGAKRDGGMLASARGVAIKTKAEEPKGKMVVFSAAQGDETAYPYKSQQHGMFTYYLLRKLQETKGDVTLGELADYITREVKRQSFDENSRSQTPSVKASASFAESWRNLKLK